MISSSISPLLCESNADAVKVAFVVFKSVAMPLPILLSNTGRLGATCSIQSSTTSGWRCEVSGGLAKSSSSVGCAIAGLAPWPEILYKFIVRICYKKSRPSNTLKTLE